ncbi:MAG: type II toxin-antitoxin system HicB family antitoxin [Burkholderiales bacterium]|nr:type II toxin-antitoxin system HicB family antitoxin [Burkholderiales bacterium]
MKYFAQITPDDGQFTVTFRDIPEAITFGSTVEEALDMAQDALETAMEFYFEDMRQVPTPSKGEDGEYAIELPVSMASKVLLLNEMVAQKVKPVDLARKLGTTRQEVNRMTNLHHATKIDTVASALKALGKELSVSVA